VAITAGALALAAARAAPAGAAVAPDRSATGYWMVASDGGVFTFGQARFFGSTGAIHLVSPVIGMAATPRGDGYWLAAADGGVFSFGNAAFHGSAGGTPLRQPVVGVAGTPSGHGYWLVASDGGIFSFGDAAFRGSTGAIHLNRPIVAMALTPSAKGYWLVASDGGIFNFGDAPFFGSTGSVRLNQPIVGMAPTPSGRGYWLVAADGGIFSFGDATFHGSTGAIHLNRPVVAGAPTPTGGGYWLVASDGGVFSFGDAAFFGSTGNLHLARPVNGLASLRTHAAPEVAAFFYPWYASMPMDGVWRHWDQGGHSPPDDVGSDYYPSRGAYSSSDAAILDAQMQDLAAAGVNTVVTSWWGRGSFEDLKLPAVEQAAAAHGLKVAAHVEPYGGRTVSTISQDMSYLRATGITDFYVYLAPQYPASDWAPFLASLDGIRVFAHVGPDNLVRSGASASFAHAAGFTGMYTYDVVAYSPADYATICGTARANLLLCAPSVGPGFSALRATGGATVRPRSSGNTYEALWNGALQSGPDLVTVTSYNEWHEGTQIEPAQAKCLPSGFCYSNYDGDYGFSGPSAATVYLQRTKFWADRFRAGT
jgi:hypothetical protein